MANTVKELYPVVKVGGEYVSNKPETYSNSVKFEPSKGHKLIFKDIDTFDFINFNKDKGKNDTITYRSANADALESTKRFKNAKGELDKTNFLLGDKGRDIALKLIHKAQKEGLNIEVKSVGKKDKHGRELGDTFIEGVPLTELTKKFGFNSTITENGLSSDLLMSDKQNDTILNPYLERVLQKIALGKPISSEDSIKVRNLSNSENFEEGKIKLGIYNKNANELAKRLNITDSAITNVLLSNTGTTSGVVTNNTVIPLGDTDLFGNLSKLKLQRKQAIDNSIKFGADVMSTLVPTTKLLNITKLPVWGKTLATTALNSGIDLIKGENPIDNIIPNVLLGGSSSLLTNKLEKMAAKRILKAGDKAYEEYPKWSAYYKGVNNLKDFPLIDKTLGVTWKGTKYLGNKTKDVYNSVKDNLSKFLKNTEISAEDRAKVQELLKKHKEGGNITKHQLGKTIPYTLPYNSNKFNLSTLVPKVKNVNYTPKTNFNINSLVPNLNNKPSYDYIKDNSYLDNKQQENLRLAGLEAERNYPNEDNENFKTPSISTYPLMSLDEHDRDRAANQANNKKEDKVKDKYSFKQGVNDFSRAAYGITSVLAPLQNVTKTSPLKLNYQDNAVLDQNLDTTYYQNQINKNFNNRNIAGSSDINAINIARFNNNLGKTNAEQELSQKKNEFYLTNQKSVNDQRNVNLQNRLDFDNKTSQENYKVNNENALRLQQAKNQSINNGLAVTQNFIDENTKETLRNKEIAHYYNQFALQNQFELYDKEYINEMNKLQEAKAKETNPALQAQYDAKMAQLALDNKTKKQAYTTSNVPKEIQAIMFKQQPINK